MKYVIEKSSRRISTVVLDCDIRKNLRRLAIAQNTSLSALINRASEEYTGVSTKGSRRGDSEMSAIFLRCPRYILHDMKVCAAEKETSLQKVALEAWMEYLDKNKHLVEKGIVIGTGICTETEVITK
jgi:hypothetical protein